MARWALVCALVMLGCESKPRRAVARVQPRVAAASTPPGPSCIDDPANCKLTYYGGHVIPNAKVYQVNWTAAVSTATDLPDFLRRITNSPYLDWMNEYSTNIPNAAHDPGTNQLVGRGVFGGTTTITPAVNTGTTVDDVDIVDELKAQIAKGALPPPDENSLYMTFFPPGYTVTSFGALSCATGGFCGYHGTFVLDGRSVYYAVLPSHDAGSGCDVGCNALTSTASHELLESITDPEVGLATAAAPPLSWYASAGNPGNYGEVSDICDTLPPDTALLPPYEIQAALSNLIAATDLANACVVERATGNDFSIEFQAATTPTAVSIAAGTSVDVPVVARVTAGGVRTLTLEVPAAPSPGLTAALSATSMPSNSTGTRLTLTAAADAATVRDLVIPVVARDGTTTHTAGLLVQVTGGVARDDFALAVSPASRTVVKGSSASYLVTTAASGTPGTLTLGTSGLPAGVTAATFSPPAIDGSGTSMLTLETSASAATALQQGFTITADNGSGLAHSTVARLSITSPAPPDYALSIDPGSGSVTPGKTRSFTVTATAISGLATGIALSVSGLPAGVTGAFDPASVGAGATSTLTLTASASAAPAPLAAFTVTGTDTLGTVRNASAQIAVAGPPAVLITRPSDGATVSGPVEIGASAAVSAGATLLRIEILVDGAVIASPAGSPAQAFWQSIEAGDGVHRIAARAVDSNGLATVSAPVNVTVHNAPAAASPAGGCASGGSGIGALLGLLVTLRRRRVT